MKVSDGIFPVIFKIYRLPTQLKDASKPLEEKYLFIWIYRKKRFHQEIVTDDEPVERVNPPTMKVNSHPMLNREKPVEPYKGEDEIEFVSSILQDYKKEVVPFLFMQSSLKSYGQLL